MPAARCTAGAKATRLCLGLRVERRHCNPGGSCHGGMLSTLADMLLVLGAGAQTGLSRYMLTVNLSCDFIAPAMEGSWIEGRLQVLRSTRNLVFCQGNLQADGALVLRLSGIAKPSGAHEASFTLATLPGRGGTLTARQAARRGAPRRLAAQRRAQARLCVLKRSRRP